MTKCYIKDYPRPQFVRGDHRLLNGPWHFRFDDTGTGHAQGWHRGFSADALTIQAPFSYESRLSGIGEERHCPSVWYCRREQFPHGEGERVLLHLEGCDYHTRVWVNGVFVGDHEGGYTRFGFDITHALEGEEAVIVVQATDSMDMTQPRGKQRWRDDNYVCWYTQTTGIWKTVWAERVAESRLERVRITPEFDLGAVTMDYELAGPLEGLEVETEITFEGRLVHRGRQQVVRRHFSHTVYFRLNNEFTNWEMTYWSPQQPRLYDVVYRVYKNGSQVDQVGSYFGMRKISAENRRLTLNNMDITLRLVLDQGYWEDGLATPPSEEALKLDLEKALEYGYNGVRKHEKIEDERFFYWADVLGVLVWCEAPSPYEYGGRSVERFTREWANIVEQHYNHPSVVTWVPFNESWGVPRIYTDYAQQQFTVAIYHLTKTLDQTRPVISNDGWEHTVSDILTFHDYARDGEALLGHLARIDEILAGREPCNRDRYAYARGYAYGGQPIMLTEFGGVAYQSGGGWGYGRSEDNEEEYLGRFGSLMDAIHSLDYVCGYCYTQLTDVQQEKNGHMTMAREDKIDPARIREILDRAE